MLIDRFNRRIDYLRISVTDKCDLRCTYCIPQGFTEFEKPVNWLSFAEIERVAGAFARMGVSRFRLTGGEPLLRKNLPDLVARLAALPGVSDLSLTTNGTQLDRFAYDLRKAGLNRLNVSLDSLRRECVQEISGKDSFDKVINSLQTARDAGFEQIKINMVPLPGVNTGDIEDMVAFCITNGFILRLIEVMPMGVSARGLDYFNLLELIENLRPKYQLHESKRVYGGGPAKYWESADGRFTLGLITPRSQHFCATCNRVRMSVDGTLYLCLGQEQSMALKPLLMANCSDALLEQAIQQAVDLKPEKHEFNEKPDKIVRIMAKTGG
ncbi:GTP 3',8-cyclase MoaA [Snodgrassella alvi]|uniref:GTP 3',8-cyclase MoaA n=1 Tax=Snodgrassella alvi TaxID=1196083 RepID=UPI000A04C2A3|nr:GTP 3',8-cyclase MoaA [Snodgrassella alvi]ORF03116.1 GTP 3',8-cyclase MoaA [Snodgrassella alvi]ORF07959.1 GTP 3',8-cyclase MoaA [Snodgrassella alvi]ORF11807.1 GTP 3',8-cyclase MoaA [Snodgrassella alvi]ORF12734.1 GTP 3',8-cyclase MoaA [Snodgrassella alvi]ORF19030.1 GTP 3',8-cyclase MoaA [Snodgrassella alvi]